MTWRTRFRLNRRRGREELTREKRLFPYYNNIAHYVTIAIVCLLLRIASSLYSLPFSFSITLCPFNFVLISTGILEHIPKTSRANVTVVASAFLFIFFFRCLYCTLYRYVHVHAFSLLGVPIPISGGRQMSYEVSLSLSLFYFLVRFFLSSALCFEQRLVLPWRGRDDLNSWLTVIVISDG